MKKIRLVCLIFLMIISLSTVQALVVEDLVPSQSEIQSLFEPYSYKPYGDPNIYEDGIDVAYTYYQSKSYYKPVREGADIFYRIQVYRFDPEDHDGEVKSIRDQIRESEPDVTYGRKELLDIGDIGYYQEIYDSYAQGPAIGCEIRYVTGNYLIWCAYNRRVDYEGTGNHYEDPALYLQRCVNILKAPLGGAEFTGESQESTPMLYVEIIPDAQEYTAGDSFRLLIPVSDQDEKPVSGADVMISIMLGENLIFPQGSYQTDDTGNMVIDGTWPSDKEGKVWVRVEIEKSGYQPGSSETGILLTKGLETKPPVSENKGVMPDTQQQPDESLRVKIGLFTAKDSSGPVIGGSIKINEDGRDVAWHPQSLRNMMMKITVPSESGDMKTVYLKTPIQSDGTFIFSNLQQYTDNPDDLISAYRQNMFDISISDPI